MNLKRLLPILSIILLLSSCSKNDRVKITGTYHGHENEYLYLARVDIDVPILIDSIKVKRSGTFSIKFNSDQINYYNLGFNGTEFITLVAAPGEIINIDFTGSTLQDDYNITGSPESVKVQQLDKKLSETYSKLDSIQKIYSDAEGEPGFDTIGPALEESYFQVIKDQRMHNISFILANLTSFSSIKALYQRLEDGTYVLFYEKDLQYLKLVSDSLNAYYPKSKQAMALATNLESELNQMYSNRLSDLANNLEPTSLDAELPDINGKMIKLSSFRGKSYVLLSFWSAQSNECIANNLQMKEYYKMYHRDGLEIYQVNLDEDIEKWKRSVKFDELPWISVRDYENGFSKVAQTYNVQSIPSNYLISPEGEIIGKDLIGRTLQIKLSQIFD
jgi:peroxiredoxin